MVDTPEVEYVEIQIDSDRSFCDSKTDKLVGFMTKSCHDILLAEKDNHPEHSNQLRQIQMCDFVVNVSKNTLIKCRYDLHNVLRAYCNVNPAKN